MLPNGLKRVAEFLLSYLLADGGETTIGSMKTLWKTLPGVVMLNEQSQRDDQKICVCTQNKQSQRVTAASQENDAVKLVRGRALNRGRRALDRGIRALDRGRRALNRERRESCLVL